MPAHAAEAAPEPAEAEELVSLEEADAEEIPARSRAVLPNRGTTSRSDETLGDDDDDDSTFIRGREEDDVDVTDIIGDV